MKLRAGLLLTIAGAAALIAQPPPSLGEGRGPGGPGGFARFSPVFRALDTDEDGELSKSEIKNAAKSLRKLDKNKDGQITQDEVRPNFPQGLPGEMVKNLMAYDKNGDGKLSKDELPERMQGMLERGDTNKDGFLTPDEIRAMAQAQQGRGQQQDGPGRGVQGGGRRMDPIFAALDLDHDGTLSKDEIDAAPESLKVLDKNGDGKITLDELRPAGLGPRGDRQPQQQ